MNQGFQIFGIDLSSEMLSKLKEKEPGAKFVQTDILEYSSQEKYDYIFISICEDFGLYKLEIERINLGCLKSHYTWRDE